MNRYVTSRRFDTGEGEIGRIFRFTLLNKFVPMGYFAGAASLKIVCILFFLHRFGRPFFRLIMPQEARLTRIYLKLRQPVPAGESAGEERPVKPGNKQS
jgi:hypothetical protein